MKEILSIHKPDKALPLIFDSPHSGLHLPEDFNYTCTKEQLQNTADPYVDELFSAAPDHGAALLCAHISRSYIDLNRAIDDIDPQLLAEPWPDGDINPSARSDAGIGLIRRLVKPGIPVYDRALSPTEIKHRIATYYHPYHDELCKIINDLHYNFGQVWHINCHSMPSTSAPKKRSIGLAGQQPKAPDFVIGNRDGTTAGPEFTRAVQNYLEGLGYSVTINDPFKGVELIKRYSAPTSGKHAIQLEINQALYMDESTGKKLRKFNAFKQDIGGLISFCADYAQAGLVDLAAD